MTALVAGLVWLVAANLIGMLPSKDHHWRNAYGLIAVGVPLLIWLICENGPWWGLAFVIAAGSVLRWPLRYLWRWIRARVGA
ncbi:DUF2484 family protein [Cypionkella sp.]|uniref:DUF2484 family protein n=1 Tax=Cypionkella sp. TaxID=2811411 RepID=UPI00271B6BF0|nr:DUF2484 family protein [Cypionkella sp.]MDO8984293.1 DUF2484 family protein [Cypionkella sp.]MDP2047967.1 DUF2484 family protein [Cypionkella sp.]